MSLRAHFQKPTDAALVAQARTRVERWDRHRRRVVLTNVALVVLTAWSFERVAAMLVAANPGQGQLQLVQFDFAWGAIFGLLLGGHLWGFAVATVMMISTDHAIRVFLDCHDTLRQSSSAFAAVQPHLERQQKNFFLTHSRTVSSDEFVADLRRSVKNRKSRLIMAAAMWSVMVLMLAQLRVPQMWRFSFWFFCGLTLAFLISAACISLIHRMVAEVIDPLATGLHFERALIALHDACTAEGVIEPHNPASPPTGNHSI